MTPDILHPTYYSPNPIDNSKAMVLTVFDMIHERMPGYFDGRDSTSHLKKSAVERADHVICISENTREDLVELFGIEAGKTSVVHLGHTVRGHLADIKPAITAPYILYVGMRQGHKNFDALLSAYGASHHLQHNFKLLCAGGGPFNRHERNRIRAMNLDEDRCMQVAADDEQLASLYAHASLFVYPSMYEGFGIPLLEAMSLDCPIVCSAAGSIPEVAGDAALYFDPSDIEELATVMASAIDDEDGSSRRVRRGRERLSQFSWNRCARETLAVYRSLL